MITNTCDRSAGPAGAVLTSSAGPAHPKELCSVNIAHDVPELTSPLYTGVCAQVEMRALNALLKEKAPTLHK